MPISLEAHYAKKVGLPHFSSHEFSLTLRVELMEIAEVESESQRLHQLLQATVDRQIQISGFTPVNTIEQPISNKIGPTDDLDPAGDWQCSQRQRELILTIAEERKMPMTRLNGLAREQFGKGLRQLTRTQASRIISRLLGF